MDEVTLHHLLVVVGVLAALLTIAPGLIWLERRLLALWQDRYGPNRAGPFGVLIVLADTIKLFFKEDWIPPFADKFVFVLAPAIVAISVLMSFVIIPFTRRHRDGYQHRHPFLLGDVVDGSVQHHPGWM